MLKKFGAVCLAAVLLLTGCTLRPQENGSKVQSISRPAVESAELQFTHPAAGEPVAVFDTTAGVFRAVLFEREMRENLSCIFCAKNILTSGQKNATL